MSGTPKNVRILEVEGADEIKAVVSANGFKDDETDVISATKPALESVTEETKTVVSTNSFKDNENYFIAATEPMLDKYYPCGSVTTMPAKVGDCQVSVNMSSIPSDPEVLKNAASAALVAVLGLSPGKNFVYSKTKPDKSAPLIKNIPAEIWLHILKFAMTAENRVFDFTDRVGNYKPNVATGLLCVSHRVYHDAKPFLYSENTFAFHRCGTDLHILNQTPALVSCKVFGCNMKSHHLKIKYLQFDLGDNASIDLGQMKVQTFTAALHALRTVIKVDNLHIGLRGFCWAATESAEDFADVLGKIQINKSLEISGPDFLLSENLRTIPEALVMKVQPEHSYTNQGWFFSKYHPAKAIEETRAKEGEVITDAKSVWDEELLR